MGSWGEDHVGFVDESGKRLLLAARFEELRERDDELVGGERARRLGARERVACIVDVEAGRLALVEAAFAQPQVLARGGERGLEQRELLARLQHLAERGLHAGENSISPLPLL